MKKILHVDLDAFFASVEELDNPELIGKPVIVGGKGERGVVATCNYEARKYGIHSAMAGFLAKKLCPDAIFIRPRKNRYSEISNKVFYILYSITDEVEKVSIDEAYIDVTELYQNPMYIAKMIKNRVLNEIGITLSVGISYNKFLAKLASDWNKPDGIKEIKKDMIPEILRPLKVNEIHGLGKKSANKLNSLGIFTVDDMLKYSKDNLISFLGSFGDEIYYRIRGIDNRKLNERNISKSYGTETTLKKDTRNKKELLEILLKMNSDVFERLNKKNKVAKTIIIKIKFYDFKTITRSKTNNHCIFDLKESETYLKILFNSINIDRSVRLIGITFTNISDKENQQLTMF